MENTATKNSETVKKQLQSFKRCRPLSAVDNEPPPPDKSPSPAASSPSAAAALSLPSMQVDLPMSPGRAAAVAFMRGISGMIGAALSPAFCRHPPTELVVGACHRP